MGVSALLLDISVLCLCKLGASATDFRDADAKWFGSAWCLVGTRSCWFCWRP